LTEGARAFLPTRYLLTEGRHFGAEGTPLLIIVRRIGYNEFCGFKSGDTPKIRR
jgi:hypothetical protein